MTILSDCRVTPPTNSAHYYGLCMRCKSCVPQRGDPFADHTSTLLLIRPHELMIATTSDANCFQLVNLARVSHKYQFRSIETWALGVLHNFYSRQGAFDAIPSSNTSSLPQSAASEVPSLVEITKLAALCERPELLELAIVRWKRQIGEGKDLALAIGISEELNIRSIMGLAYHAMMLKGKAYWDSDPSLTRDQKVRLLCGYYSLSKMWEVLPSQPPPIAHSTRCTGQQRCAKAWGALWKNVLEMGSEVIPGLQKEDVLSKLMLVESIVKTLVEKDIQPQCNLDGLPPCKENALIATTLKVREFKETLTDYFLDDFF